MCKGFFSDFLGIFKAGPAVGTSNSTVPPALLESSLKDFQTLEDLEAWYDLHKELRMEAPNICDDYARESRALAEVDGYDLSLCLVYAGYTYGVMIFDDPTDITKPNLTVFHVANLAIVLTDESHGGQESCYYLDLAWGKIIYLTGFFSGGKY